MVGHKKAFINGKIFTSDKNNLYAESLIVEDGMIKWVGKNCDMPKGDYEYVDLNGKSIIPGLIDCHMHPVILADCAAKISCLPPNVNSIEELETEIAKAAKNKKEGEWIQGWGYDEEKFAEHRAPNRWDLDKGSRDFPVELLRSCSHVRSVNSKALELAGITKDTPDPSGGEIDRDENGEPTGILRENARHLIGSVLPEKSREQVVNGIVDLGTLLLSQGIIAVCDMGNIDSVDYYDYYVEAANKGFKQEVGMYYIWDLIRKNPDFKWDKERADKNKQIHMSGIKIIADGSVGGRTAWMDKPYKGSTDEYGISVCTDEEIESAMEFCKLNSCQLSFHAMGKRTIDRVVEKTATVESWIHEIPHLRIEHVTDPSEKAINIAAQNNIAFVTQSIFMYSEIESYLNNLGEEWIKETYPIQHIIDKGVKIALSTDAPATSWAVPSDPFPNIKCAVTRYAYDGTDCGRDNCIDVETAIQMYTREAAEIAGFKKVGQIKEGYKASFAILSDDIFTISAEHIDNVKIEATYMNGEMVYKRS